MKKILSIALVFSLLLSTFAGITAQAGTVISMAQVYSDNMVLKAGKEVKLAGEAASGSTVTASFVGGSNTYTAAAAAGLK